MDGINREVLGKFLLDKFNTADPLDTLGIKPTCKPFTEGTITAPCGQCPQEQFFAATEFDVLYGGAAGGGKTWALVAYAICKAVEYPGLRCLTIRRTYDELAESIFPELQKLGYGAAVGAKWNGSDRELRFTNGSVIRYRYVENIVDASVRQGGQYQLLCVDERTLMSPGVVDILVRERLRTVKGTNVPVIGVRSTCNPGGASHSEVKTRYIDATQHGQTVVVDEQGFTHRFIPAKATDNTHLDEAYYRNLDAIPDPMRRAAMRDGSWDLFAGQMFGEWRYDRHTVDPLPLPDEWQRYMGLDYGYAAPFAAVWAALDNDKRLWVYRDISRTQVTEEGQAKLILAAEAGERIAVRLADPSMWAKKGAASSPASIYGQNGVHLKEATNDRVIGWQRVHSFLADGPACALHREQGWETCPMMHVFRTCSEVIRTLPALPHAKTGNPEDADTHADDHIPDALRYLCMGIGAGQITWVWDTPKTTHDNPHPLVAHIPASPVDAFNPLSNNEGAWVW